MNRTLAFVTALMSLGIAADLRAGEKNLNRQVSFEGMPLSFEPNVGQAEAGAKFVAHGAGYEVQLDPSRAQFRFGSKAHESRTVTMHLAGDRGDAEMAGEALLPGKANYLPTKNPNTWHTNIPTYSRVRYTGVYPGVDLAFYGNPSRLEYDFVVQPDADVAAIGLKFSGADQVNLDASGDLLLRLGKGDIRFLKPVAYQTSLDGKRREPVEAGYQLHKSASGEPALISFSIGRYDHARRLVIDPVAVPSLIYSEYLSGYAAAVTVDSSGNAYVTGQNSNNNGFYVTKFNSTGTVVYNTTVGSGPNVWPYGIALDSTGKAYVTGQIYSGSTLPTSSNAYQSTVTGSYNAFLAVISADGSTVPYATYLGGSDSSQSAGLSVAVDSSQNAYISGWTESATFPTTSGAYQTAFSPSQDGIVVKINPLASTGPTSLVYSTLLGPGNSYLIGIAVDSSGDAYVTGFGAAGFPVTAGAFRYSGVDSTSGGVYVTKLNSTASALVYSAYLGYGTGYGIAVEGQSNPSAYVTGEVNYADFPTTSGAYQTSYAGGFATKLSSDGSTETYSTFLGGPSSYTGGTAVLPTSIALPNGCSSSCNAYIAGYTNTADFPAINPIQSTPSNTGNSGFIVELAADGGSALFSSYLSGYNSGVYNQQDSQSFGITPSIGVDSSGNMSVVGDIYSTSDFPITISTANPTYAFLAKIGPATTPFTIALPSTINFGNQAVGVSTSISNGTATVRLRNMSATAATLQSITTSASIFSESDNCGGSIPAGGFCTLSLNFTPAAPGARTGTVTVTSNASDSPTTITVNGTGVDAPYITASPTSLVFGDQATGTSSAQQSVTLTNIGDETAALSVYTNTVNFSELNNCPSQLAPGSSCLVNVTFSPTQPGLATDNLYFYSPSFGTGSIPLSGSGTVTGANSAISLSATSLSFGNQVVNTTSPIQQIFVTNNGSVPIVIQSITTSVTSGSGNFTISYNACGNPTGSLSPQANCQLQVTFTPTAAGTVTGTLTINDSATGSPQTVSLTGTGVAATETLEFYPGTAIAFPDTPVGVTSGSQIVYAQNTGTAPITMDRVVVSGDFHISSTTCEATTLPGTLNDGASGSYSYCYAYVVFTPTATGARTGTLTFIDSASTSPQVVNLSGNGITASGTLALDPTQLDFPSQAIGTTSAASSSEAVYLSNPGNTPITINNWSATGDFTVTNWYCSTPPFTLNPGGSCGIYIQFTPSASGTRTGTLTVNSTAGNQTAALNGTGVTATQTIQITPTSMTFGSVVVGQTASQYPLYIQNTGTEPVSLTTLGALSGTNAGDFTVNTYTCPVGGNLQPGTSCEMLVSFTPGGTGSRTASLQNVDSAGTQNVPLSGTGVSATPTYTTSYAELVYNSQVQGTTSPTNTYTYFYNNGTLPVTLGTATVTSGFVKPSGDDTCSGSTITGGGNCYVYVSFAPTTPGYTTGTLTFKNSSNTTLATVALAGYSPAAANSAYLDPTGLNFTNQVVTTTSNYQTLTLYNSGNLPFTVGTLNGTNVGTPPTDEFSISSGNGGGDNCSGQTVQPGSSCSAYVTFTPSATGTRTGSLSFPVTYADSTTATFTATLAGTGVAETNSAVVSPTAASFVDQTVGATTPYTVQLNLTNSGNQPFTVGTLSGTNTIVGSSGTGEFSTSSANGGSDNCSHVTLQPGSTCIVYVTFTPSATGTQTGSITFPVTFKDGTTANPTATLSGNGVAANKGLQISPLSLQFPVQVVSTTSSAQGITVKNLGNTPVHFGTDSVTGDFAISYDSCVGTNLAYNQTCQINVTFTPSTTGNRTGTLTIADNGTGGPHAVSLSGTGIPANQQITLSQTTVAFGNQPAGSTSSQMAVYITNQSDSTVTGFTIALGGTNPSDFTLNTNNCPTGGGNLGARATCAILVAFAPVTGTSGALSATVTVTDSDSGSPRTITLTGTSVTAGPAVAFTPGSGLTFASQSVGTTSPAQTFSVTNTGTANLTITAVTSTDATEFPIYSDGCTGATLLPHQQCTVSVRFSPSTGGARSSTIKVTDNATGSPQSLPVSGTGVGIPVAGVSPSSLTFSSQGTGTRSASQPVTISNTGTGPLTISNIDISGGNPADFAQTNTCGTLPATVAVGATCTINVTFAPTAAGTRTSTLNITDNSGNTVSIQKVTLNGTGFISQPSSVSVTPNPASGLTNTFVLKYSDTGGYGNLNLVGVLFNSVVASANSCEVEYFPATNRLYLINDAGTASLGPITPGSGTLNNSQCTVTGSGTSVSHSGNNFTLNLELTASSSFTGKHTTYMYAADNSPANTGWVNNGTWTPATNQPPTVVSVTPNSFTGMSNTFALEYSDPNGNTDLYYVGVVFNTAVITTNSCVVYYYPASNRIILITDAGGQSLPLTPGSSGSLSNSQCTISGSGSSVVRSGSNLTLNLAVTASSSYMGTKNIFMIATDNSAASTGWINEGTWTP